MSLKPSINWLFVFIPLTVVLEHLGGVPDTVIFLAAALSIIPIASLIERSTGHLATHTGDAVGGLLSATFGNAPELIMALVALKAGYVDMVRATIVGTILANLLLVLGTAFLFGGLRHHDQDFSASASRVYSSMMLIAVMSLCVPSAFSRFFAPDGVVRQEQVLNIGIVVVLFAAYLLYLLFMLKTHPAYFASVSGGEKSHVEGETWSLARSVVSLLGATVLVAWMSEILVGAAEGTGQALGLSQTFMGIVFLSIIGGAAQSIPAVVMARKNKMDLTVGMLMGSCIQIVLFVAPVLVVASFFMASPLMLSFNRAETGALVIGVLLATVVCGDGRSNWYKGVQLITIYLVIALMFYFIPATGH